MIKPGEIDKIAIENGVRAKQIEKDYVISWVLWGIAKNEFLDSNLTQSNMLLHFFGTFKVRQKIG